MVVCARDYLESLNRMVVNQKQDIDTLSNLIYKYRAKYSEAKVKKDDEESLQYLDKQALNYNLDI